MIGGLADQGNIHWNEELARFEKEQVRVSRAYGYLTDSVTRAIYNEFGVPGLVVFEKNKATFLDLQEEMRSAKADIIQAGPQQTSSDSVNANNQNLS